MENDLQFRGSYESSPPCIIILSRAVCVRVYVCEYVSLCVRVCVREKERGKERERDRERKREGPKKNKVHACV